MNKYLYEDIFLVISNNTIIVGGEEIQIENIDELKVEDKFAIRTNSFIIPTLFTKNILISLAIAALVCSFVFILIGLKSRYSLTVKTGAFSKKIYESDSLEKLNEIKAIIEAV